MKKHVFLSIALAAIAFLSGCGNKEKAKQLKIGVSIPAATHGWSGGVVWEAEQNKIKNASKAEIIIAASQNPAEQANSIENLMANDIDALVVMAQEPGPLTQICKQAKEKGIFLTVVSNPLSEKVEDIFVNGDNVSFGEAAGEAINQILSGKGNILVMEGIPCPINTQRVDGFKKTLAKYPDIRILESQPANWNTEKGLALMESFLLKYPKIDAVWAGDDDVLLGAIKAYKESKRTDVKGFVGGGGCKNIVKQILDNDANIKATVTYPPQMIQVAIDATISAIVDKTVPSSEIIVKSQIVTPANAKEHYFPDSVY